MNLMPVPNQTITEMLPARKVEPSAAPSPEGFDRKLKDADARLDRPSAADDSQRNAPRADKPEPAEQPTTAADKADPLEQDKPTHDAQVAADDSAEVNEGTGSTDNTDTTETDPQPVTGGGTEAAAAETVAVVVADAQLVDQVLAPTTSEATTNVLAEQAEAATTTQTIDQAANQTVAEAASAQATGDQVDKPVATIIQPQQVKAENAQQAQNTNQAEPTASAERVAFVSESRQQDARQSTADDAGQQQQDLLKGDGKPQASTSAQISNQTTTASITADATSAGVRAFTAVDGTVQNTGAATPAGPAVQTQSADNTELNTARIARGMQNAIQQKGGSVTLRLTPPEMGTVRIQLQIQNGTVNATFHAETESTRTMLNQQMSQLRTALEHQGLGVERLSVQSMPQSSNASMQQDAGGERDGQSNDGRSRGGFTQQGGRQGQQSDTPDQQQAFEQELTNAA